MILRAFFIVLIASVIYVISLEGFSNNDKLLNSNNSINKIFLGEDSNGIIVLYDNNRFASDIEFLNQIPVSNSGYWLKYNDTLIFIIDDIICNITDLMKISFANIFRFKYYINHDTLEFVNAEMYRGNQFFPYSFEDTEDYFNPYLIKFYKKNFDEIANKKNLSYYCHFIQAYKNFLKYETIALANTYWKSNNNLYFFKFTKEMYIELINLEKNTIRFGYPEHIYENDTISKDFKIILNNILFDDYFEDLFEKNKLSIKSVRLDKMRIHLNNNEISIVENKYVDGIVGNESDYYEWYDFDNFEYKQALKIKVKNDYQYDGVVFSQISENEYNSFINQYQKKK